MNVLCPGVQPISETRWAIFKEETVIVYAHYLHEIDEVRSANTPALAWKLDA